MTWPYPPVVIASHDLAVESASVEPIIYGDNGSDSERDVGTASGAVKDASGSAPALKSEAGEELYEDVEIALVPRQHSMVASENAVAAASAAKQAIATAERGSVAGALPGGSHHYGVGARPMSHRRPSVAGEPDLSLYGNFDTEAGSPAIPRETGTDEADGSIASSAPSVTSKSYQPAKYENWSGAVTVVAAADGAVYGNATAASDAAILVGGCVTSTKGMPPPPPPEADSSRSNDETPEQVNSDACDPDRPSVHQPDVESIGQSDDIYENWDCGQEMATSGGASPGTGIFGATGEELIYGNGAAGEEASLVGGLVTSRKGPPNPPPSDATGPASESSEAVYGDDDSHDSDDYNYECGDVPIAAAAAAAAAVAAAEKVSEVVAEVSDTSASTNNESGPKEVPEPSNAILKKADILVKKKNIDRTMIGGPVEGSFRHLAHVGLVS